MQRIMITGVTGSGKTTLAGKLSEKLGIGAVDLDDLYWLPGWQQRETADVCALASEATAGPSWIVAGNYGQVRDTFWNRADTLVWLDYSFPVVFQRLLSRSLYRIIDREDCCNGNRETWRRLFSKNSIMLWLLKSFKRRRYAGRDIFSRPQEHSHLRLIRLASPHETEGWLQSL